jgi:hypothetical protein
MPSWSIGSPEQERVEVELLSPPVDEAGYDWARARARVAAGAFRADFDMMILGSDLARFRQQLEPVYRDLRGSAEFTTLENQLYLKVEVDRTGHARVTGYAKDDVNGNCLTFELRLDQTHLKRTLSELSDVLSELQKGAA